MTNQVLAIDTDETLALLGLCLMLVVAKLATQGGFLARRAIDGIAVIGWVVDHLPQSATNGGL